jgi:hypothetical protein
MVMITFRRVKNLESGIKSLNFGSHYVRPDILKRTMKSKPSTPIFLFADLRLRQMLGHFPGHKRQQRDNSKQDTP